MNKTENLFIALANAFPVWVVLGAGLALWEPATATWFQPTWIPYFLALIMLSMGLTLTAKDFVRILEIPGTILLGVALQYLVMPLLAFGLAHLFELPIDFVIGLVLVGCCPGGTASNVVCFIARLNVQLIPINGAAVNTRGSTCFHTSGIEPCFDQLFGNTGCRFFA